MPDNSTFACLLRLFSSAGAGCGIGATPEVRRRLLGLAVAVLAPAVLPECGSAQTTASGSVRVVIRKEALPAGALEQDSEALLWMAPESAAATERLTGLWAAGEDAQALATWRSVIESEVEAQRLATEEQALAAADWVARRALSLLSRRPQYGSDLTRRQRAEEIQRAARFEAVAALEGLD
jgi:hypothetical protein